MVARGEKPRCQSPHFNVHVELDNRALKAKNNTLTQTVAKLQQDNAELLKQITLLQGESFEINSKYNNLKNVISIIDSTTKTCLPKLNEVVETFTGIIQLCAVASNISNSHRDTRTQAVKPQIVNGHVLHNPTITLSRLESNVLPNTNRLSSNVTIRSGTSRGSNEVNNETNPCLSGTQEPDSESDSVDNSNGNEEQDNPFVCHAPRGVYKRKRSCANMDTLRLTEEEFDDGDEEMPAAEEEDAHEEDESDQRLTTIQEDEEDDEEEMSSSVSSRAKQHRFVKGRLQEVRIYLNQLPNNSVDQIGTSGNISISVSPTERRSSYKQRSSSIVGELNESSNDNEHSFLDENISHLNRSLNVALENSNLSPIRTMNSNKSKLSMTFHSTPGSSKSSQSFESNSDACNNDTLQFSDHMSAINDLPTTSKGGASPDSSNNSKSRNLNELSLMSLDLHYKTSTPFASRKSNENSLNHSGSNNSLNKSIKNENSFTLKSNITQRRATSREKRKIAQVLLNNLSLEKRLSRSPINRIKDIVQTPPRTKPSKIKTLLQNSEDTKIDRGKSNISDEENINSKKAGTRARRKKDSPTKKIDIKRDTFVKPKFSPQKSPVGRPKRAARPKTLKEPNLSKKLRRSR